MLPNLPKAKSIEIGVSATGTYTINGLELAAKDANNYKVPSKKPAMVNVICRLLLLLMVKPVIKQ
jgi:hypothetical protein